MILNDIGLIVEMEWKRTAQLRKNIILDEYIVMPNHIHGIIVLNNKHGGRGTMHRAPTYNGTIWETCSWFHPKHNSFI